MEFTVTLSALREAGACFPGYNKVVRMLQGAFLTEDDEKAERYFSHQHDAPISLLSILDSNELDDALWSLRCVPNCDRDARLYAVWCARQVQHLMTDQRSLNALDIAEKFANVQATEEELDAAGDAAWVAARAATNAATGDAARDAAWVAARDAARAATNAAARAAAWDAARAAAWVVAWDAARAAAWDAARAATNAAAWDATNAAARAAAWDAAWAAAWDAARAAARDAQKGMFIAMCEGRSPWQQARQVQLQRLRPMQPTSQ
jgi:hypothetical protein